LDIFSQIFIPVVHSKHWFLIAISILEGTVYVLDSFPNGSWVEIIAAIYSRIKGYLQDSHKINISNYKWFIPPVELQNNTLVISFNRNKLQFFAAASSSSYFLIVIIIIFCSFD